LHVLSEKNGKIECAQYGVVHYGCRLASRDVAAHVGETINQRNTRSSEQAMAFVARESRDAH